MRETLLEKLVLDELTMNKVIPLDAVIFGGGVAGLWLLDRLSRQGSHAILLETNALGAGQTIASQGIIHGGLKYSLQGLLTRAARHISEMPLLWRQSLVGQSIPNLTNTRLRGDCCYLWQTDSISSRVGMWGARLGLSVVPEVLSKEELPEALQATTGIVARLGEQVIAIDTLLADLRQQYLDRILKIDSIDHVEFQLVSPGEVRGVRLTDAASGVQLEFRTRQIVFLAGRGNGELRRRVGLDPGVMQLRPLHMVLARGPLPELNGHCVDGATTRVTITSDQDSAGRMVWQIGGQLAEDGARMGVGELIERTRSEIHDVLPGVSLDDVEWSTYSIHRAEGLTLQGGRPDSVQVLCAGNVTTGWPTKLALAPILAREIAPRVEVPVSRFELATDRWRDWPRPEVAELPWNDSSRNWWRTADGEERNRAA